MRIVEVSSSTYWYILPPISFFIHPVRTKRWRLLSLPIALAWTFFAGWAAWVDFHPESWAHWGLVVTSIYLTLAGIAQQIIPERKAS